jgi:membrane fusion protein, multidrug efflux system
MNYQCKKLSVIALVSIALLSCDKPESKVESNANTAKSTVENTTDVATDANTQKPQVSVEALTVSIGQTERFVQGAGTILPYRESYVVSESQGKIKSVHFNLGSYVKQGQALVQIECAPQQAALQQSLAALEQAQLALSVAQSLHEAGSGSQMELLQSKAAVSGAMAAKQSTQLAVENCTVTAPFSGWVALKENAIEVGNLLAGGAVVARIVDTHRLKLSIPAGEQDIAYVQKGQKVRVTVQAAADSLQAAVSAVAPASNPSLPSFMVEVQWKNTMTQTVKPGMSAWVNILTGSTVPAIIIPLKSVVTKLGEQGVYVVRNGVAAFKTVQLGTAKEDMVQVKSGLQEGEVLIISGLESISVGTPITHEIVGNSGEVQ